MLIPSPVLYLDLLPVGLVLGPNIQERTQIETRGCCVPRRNTASRLDLLVTMDVGA
jgi:hypothetical protein